MGIAALEHPAWPPWGWGDVTSAAILNRKLWVMGSHLRPEAVADTGVHLGCGNGGAGGNLVSGGVGGRPSLSRMTSRLAAAILDAMVSGGIMAATCTTTDTASWRPSWFRWTRDRGSHLDSRRHVTTVTILNSSGGIMAAILLPVDTAS